MAAIRQVVRISVSALDISLVNQEPNGLSIYNNKNETRSEAEAVVRCSDALSFK